MTGTNQTPTLAADPADGARRAAPPWVLLLLVCIGQFMVVLDISIVNVALPSIQADLGFSASGLQWVVNAYTLAFAGFLLLGGRAADLFGRRRMFVVGLGMFTDRELPGRAGPDPGTAHRRPGAAGAGRRGAGSGHADPHHHELP